MKRYRVMAKSVSWYELYVDAETEEDALKRADASDGGEWDECGLPEGGTWEVDPDSVEEVMYG